MRRVLDHGFVELVDYMGSDEDVIRAARMSTQKGFLGWGTEEKPGDERLLKYLWKHQHLSCFEFCSVVLDLQLPIFVARQLMRHWSFSFNEASARYSPLPEFSYLPTVERLIEANETSLKTSNRQAQGKDGVRLSREQAVEWLEGLETRHRDLQAWYEYGISIGITKELARGCDSVFKYTRLRMHALLRDMLMMLKKRLPEDAQWETRMFAQAMHDTIEPLFPRTLALFDTL